MKQGISPPALPEAFPRGTSSEQVASLALPPQQTTRSSYPPPPRLHHLYHGPLGSLQGDKSQVWRDPWPLVSRK
ncbi:hypothetical protein E2C01_035217 [Portunus trituberculatus]|uniref:Uncharacterized protein n=1 Tax=Portunus trituberculatus TaxID=210409 RepID=A0A5B7F7R8_PORTR|nr:hypothetical protein [Portunus trituberculatus]